MNIGSSYYTSSLTRQFSQLQDAQAKAQGMLATGKKFVEASDNPNAALDTQRISLTRLHLKGDAQRRNLADRLNETARLNEGKAREMLKGAFSQIDSDSSSGLDGSLGETVDSYLEQAVAFLNFELDGRHLFGGDASFGGTGEPKAPFELLDTDGNGSYDEVAYHGSTTENMEFEIGLGVRMDPAADAKLNDEWVTWMNSILDSKNAYLNGDITASKTALEAAEAAEHSSLATINDLIGKSLRIHTIDEWASQADTNFANREATIQEVDVNEVALQFNELQRNYQASLQSGRMLLSLSLIDFI